MSGASRGARKGFHSLEARHLRHTIGSQGVLSTDFFNTSLIFYKGERHLAHYKASRATRGAITQKQKAKDETEAKKQQ